jgi:hypothetical protein
MAHPYKEVEDTVLGLRAAFVEAERRNTWSWIADEFYAPNCVYTCPYGGTIAVVANGREEIRRTHYGRDMDVGSGWAGWSFPILNYAINGDFVITHWVNRGPGLLHPDLKRDWVIPMKQRLVDMLERRGPWAPPAKG